VQSLNDFRLHHQFLAAGVTTFEAAFKQREAYLQANSLHRPHMSSHQVEAEIWELKLESAPTTHVAATSELSLATEVATMVGRLVVALMQSQLTDPSRDL